MLGLEPVDRLVAVFTVGAQIGREMNLGNVVPVAEVNNLPNGWGVVTAGDGDETYGGEIANHAGMIVAAPRDCKQCVPLPW